jgi:short-subunit dehydrogenase
MDTETLLNDILTDKILRRLNGLTVLVTGATSGIGLQIAKVAAAQGANLILVARDATRLDVVASSLRGAASVQTEVADLTAASDLEALLARLEARNAQVDVFVNNAGVGASGTFVGEDWAKLDAMLRLHVLAVARLSHWAAQRMLARGRGAIVNLSAAVATRPTPHFAAYAASKAFITNLSQALHEELAGSGVTVTAVHPPAVATRFADAGYADLKSTLVLRLFPAVSATKVAVCALKAGLRGRRSISVGPIAAAIMASAPIVPAGIDLGLMAWLFRHRQTARA